MLSLISFFLPQNGHAMKLSLSYRLGYIATVLSCTIFLHLQISPISCLSAPSTSNRVVSSTPATFSVPLSKSRPKPETVMGKLNELWNDPRPVTSVIGGGDSSNVGTRATRDGTVEEIPYCIISDEFEVVEGKEAARFQVLLYPRGRFVGAKSGDGDDISGPAALYLRYLPSEYGDEVDIAWKLRLVDERTGKALPVATSGGLPKSEDTWSSALTFCAENEAVESVGRATDWGSSSWYARDVCHALGNIKVEGEVTFFDCRKGESMFSWPPASKGGIGAVRRATAESSQLGDREFRVGEVIVPVSVEDDALRTTLEKSFIYPGIDYRIMTMADKEGNSIFSTLSLPFEERQHARLALRPCGWKSQQFWQKRGMETEWPVEVEAGRLASTALTRFNAGSALPRIVSAFSRDSVALSIAVALALAPVPLTLVGRTFVSLYDIPSASMEPTLMKGDVLLVEKFPGAFERTKRGDVILFSPPQSLQDIITRGGRSPIGGTSLFVKRVVGMPGDKDIAMDLNTQEVRIGNERAVGPDRNLCDDEPLRLIDALLEDGKGITLDKLGEDDVYVLGDCKAVSVDSRVFGVLPKENVVGRPLARIWPVWRISLGPL